MTSLKNSLLLSLALLVPWGLLAGCTSTLDPPVRAPEETTQGDAPVADEYLVGDWEGTSTHQLAVRIASKIYVDVDFDGYPDREMGCVDSIPGDEYLVGDWDGDGRDNIGIRRNNLIMMCGDQDYSAFHFGDGISEDGYLVGDWDGDGRDNIAVRRANRILKDLNFDGAHDLTQSFGDGNSEDGYLVGDWDGDGRDNIAVRRNNLIIFDTFTDSGRNWQEYGDGIGEDEYLVGDWDGDGDDNIAVRRGNLLLMDTNFDGAHELTREFPIPPDFSLFNFHITQATQTYYGGVPLVAGREGLARAWVGTSFETPQPVSVRLHAYLSGVELGSLDTLAQPASLASAEGDLASTYNVKFPSEWLRPGLEVHLEVDPDNVIAESNENNNRYPPWGLLEFDVREVPELEITLIPVTFEGVTSEVNHSNAEEYLDLTRRIYPLPGLSVEEEPSTDAAIQYEIHEPYTFTWPSMNTGRLLSEIRALRVDEGSDRYYYAIFPPVGNPDAGGRAYVGWSPVAVGWVLPYGKQVMAHELGHNWGRWHAPCGGPRNVDLSYPYLDGSIGTFGFDLLDSVIRSLDVYKDVMSYCDPDWISDYNFKAVLAFRENEMQAVGLQTQSGPEPVLLISGRNVSGQVTLDPAFEVVTQPAPPEPGGYTLVGLNAAGQVLFEVPFSGTQVADGPEELHFVFTVPLGDFTAAEIAALQVVGERGQVLTETTQGITTQAVQPTEVTRLTGGRVQVTWDASAYPAVMIRDGVGGQVLSIARGGDVVIKPSGSELELIISNGIGSVTEVIAF